MPLARIFSRYPEQTTTLSEQLQQQGYRVEVLSPDEAPTTLADLEIQLEVCDPADVLRRAAELALHLKADIAVAPGALPALAHEVAAPATHDVAATPEFATVPEPVIAHAQEETEAHSDAAAPDVRWSHLAGAARASGAALAACAAGAGNLLASVRAGFGERLERARVRSAEAHQRRQERLLELTRRRAEVHQHASALKSSRRVLDAYLLQFEREHPDVLPDAGSKPSPAAELPVRAWQARIRGLRVNKWEAVMAGAVSAIALFVAGLAVSSFHSRPSPSANGGVTVRSGGVTVPGPQTKAASPARPSPAVRKTRPTPKTATQARRTPRKLPQRSQDTRGSDVVVRRFSPPKPTPPTSDGWKHFSDVSN